MSYCLVILSPFLFFFNDTATTEIYTLSLHDALPICTRRERLALSPLVIRKPRPRAARQSALALYQLSSSTCVRVSAAGDRKSTRLNSSHANISYAVFCLKKKKTHLNYSNVHNTYPAI